MNPDRAIAVILAVSLGVVLLLGIWLLRRAHSGVETTPSTPTATAAPTFVAPTVTPGVAVQSVASGYRLAGTVVGDLSYAIIEDPRGANQLYHLGQTVPGLGEVTAIEANSITLAGKDGTLALQLAPAATTTPTPRAGPARSEWSPAATPAHRLRRDQSESESSP
jgi:hypothetical protein